MKSQSLFQSYKIKFLHQKVNIRASCWPCCCVSYCPWPPLHDPPPLVGSWTCDWWILAGFVVIAPVPIHQWTWALYSASHLRRGQFLHLQTPLEKKLKEFPFLLHLCHNSCRFSLVPLRSLRFRADPPVSVVEGVAGAWLELLGRKLAVFVHSFDRLGSFVAPKAWEHKSPKPLEKRKLRWKSQQKVQPLQQRRTDRYIF